MLFLTDNVEQIHSHFRIHKEMKKFSKFFPISPLSGPADAVAPLRRDRRTSSAPFLLNFYREITTTAATTQEHLLRHFPSVLQTFSNAFSLNFNIFNSFELFHNDSFFPNAFSRSINHSKLK